MPRHPFPPPLRGAEPGSFAEETITRRLPRILRQTIEENRWTPGSRQKLETLLAEIPDGPLRPVADGHPDNEVWTVYLAPFLGQSWLEAPWLVVEIYLYRRILAATGYFTPGPEQGRDPFAGQKSPADALSQLAGPADRVARLLPAGRREEALSDLLKLALWGNQADRSMFPGGEGQPAGHDTQDRADHTLVDHSAEAHSFLLAHPHPRIDLLLDNAGEELASDLLLTDFLLTGGVTRTVHLHAKRHPFFVSDATPRDVWATVLALGGAEGEVGRSGRRLLGYLEQSRLRLEAHPFWTLPRGYRQMPADLRGDLARSALLISKGDANYRRWLGDRPWGFTLPAAEVIDYAPAPLLSLRTGKAPVAVGLDPRQVARLDEIDSDWLIGGRYGMIQLVLLVRGRGSEPPPPP